MLMKLRCICEAYMAPEGGHIDAYKGCLKFAQFLNKLNAMEKLPKRQEGDNL